MTRSTPKILILLVIISGLITACKFPIETSHILDDEQVVRADERVVRANVVALEQPLFYNRFGSVNPYGMIYALSHDVVDVQDGEEWLPGLNCPSAVRLRDGKRPRPLVIRGNVDDVLEITFTNKLLNDQPDISQCKLVDQDSPYSHLLNEEDQISLIDPPEHEQRADEGETAGDHALNDWPLTRSANIVIPGLTSLSGTDLRCNGLKSVNPGESVTCQWKLEREGAHLFASHGAPAGGEGEGGSLTHGLFGVVIVEPKDSKWYRSQVSASIMDAVWQRKQADDDARLGSLNYDLVDPNGNPYLNMLKLTNQVDDAGRPIYELIHSDLNAIILEKNPKKPEAPAFREFTVVFHDELKTFYAGEFQELEQSRQLSGVGDGFAINYGASGMGSILLANRKGIGPSAQCVECLYEEFFLQSWANGDPALLENFVDDPSNVHHSYLNDRIKFRNLHAGPKETHVFHLHAHQWLSSADNNSGTYLDSQTIAPQQAFDYEIYDGGLSQWGNSGQYKTNGSGNRNRTPGDSIFHCHLYPHFAQGMWALWRIHDVIEDGTRKLPDGQPSVDLLGNPQVALSIARQDSTGKRGGTNPMTGITNDGTPIPALIPLPDQGLPPLPTYGSNKMPGYPFYIPGEPGHRAPQPPLDFAKNEQDQTLHGGLPRHVIHGGERKPVFLNNEDMNQLPEDATERANLVLRQSLAMGDFRLELTQADIELLAHEGEPLERQAMQFHAGKATSVRLADGTFVEKQAGKRSYPTITPNREEAEFFVNGADPAPGAPFADPCGVPSATSTPIEDEFTKVKGYTPDPALIGFRKYEVSAIGLDLVVNKAGWHDPQARINVLTQDAEAYEDTRRHDMEPFFFRAASGECIEFRHQNRTHKELELDDFQVATPTDTIGQHIHLVKFDVTSSDGSGNGFNYEDGTLARSAVEERIHAANAFGGARDQQETRRVLTPGKTLDGKSIEPYQTTIQRWFADPLLTVKANMDTGMGMHGMHETKQPDMPCPIDSEKQCKDRTLRTVFTHDHFAPSSIQQHGFYSALLVEPAGSVWLKPNGDPLLEGVGSQAMIVNANDWLTHENHREFALAVADFALLYEPRTDDAIEVNGMGRLLNEAAIARETGTSHLPETAFTQLDTHARNWWNQHGRPVDAPFKPEAISKDHHNPYLVNYKHEPIPLRIGQMEDKFQIPENTKCGKEHVDLIEKRQSITRQRDGTQGDLAYVFDTYEHGDPCTPILEAYEGEKIQIRMIQGAQEVQHMFAVEGMHWPRVIDYMINETFSDEQLALRDNPLALVSAQEIGISEHFEMKIPLVEDIGGGPNGSDFLYHFGTIDALWNGAWGLIRSYNGTSAPDPESCFKDEDGTWATRRSILNTSNDQCETPIGNRLQPVPGHGNGKIKVANASQFGASSKYVENVCPITAPKKNFLVVATRLDRLGADYKITYDENHGIYDPDGLILLPMPYQTIDPTLDDVRTAYANKAAANELEPLVLRVNAGDCINIRLVNHLAQGNLDENKNEKLPDVPGDALMPKIVPLNVENHVCLGNDPACEEMMSVQPSSNLALSITTLPSKNASSTLAIGQNNQHPLAPNLNQEGENNGEHQGFQLYAGQLKLMPNDDIIDTEGRLSCPENEACSFTLQATPYAFGTVPIKAFGDVISHGVHGLFGALIVEPKDAIYLDPETLEKKEGWELGTQAFIQYTDENGELQRFHEFVLMYQDGLNLHWASPWDEKTRSVAIGNCPICDDSYDRGEKGINYRSAPFWARLRQGTGPYGNAVAHDTGAGSNLNQIKFPTNFLQESWSSISTPIFETTAGEEVRFRVLQPHGRARQRAFLSFGHDYKDLLPEFGSPHAALMAPGKAMTAILAGGAKEGCYIYRDGPMQMFSGGVWGHFKVNPTDSYSLKCESPVLARNLW